MKKVLIFYAAYGGGHFAAARSLKEYIDENFDDVYATLFDCMKYINKYLEKVTTGVYREMAKKAPWAWGKVYYHSQKGALSKFSIDSNKLMSIKLNKFIQDFEPDLIISTHPFSSQMCSYLKSKGKLNCEIATILTDFAPHEQWLVGSDFIDYFFVSHDDMKIDLYNTGISNEKIFVTGIPLSHRFLKEYNKNEIIDSLCLSYDKKTVLFFGGGEFGLGKTSTFDVFNVLLQDISNIQVIAIAGKNKKMYDEFFTLVQKHKAEHFVKILEFTDKVPELMSIADIVITKPGGLTTTESLCSGLPMVVINPIPGQEEENAEFLENNGIAIWIKKEDNYKHKLVELFNSPEKLKEMSKKATSIAKPDSTKNICNILLK